MHRRRSLDEILLHLKKHTHEDIESSEVIINYNDGFRFSNKMECSLINLHLPPKLYTNGFPQVSLDFIFQFVGLTTDQTEVINNPNKPMLTDMPESSLFLTANFGVFTTPNTDQMTTKQLLQDIKKTLNAMRKAVGERSNEWRADSFVDGKFVNRITEKSLTFSYKLENGLWKINFGQPGQLLYEMNDGTKKVIAKYHYCPDKILHDLLGISDEFPLIKLKPRKTGITYRKKDYFVGVLLNEYDNRLVSVNCSIIQNSYVNNLQHYVLKQLFLEKDESLYRFEKNYFIPLCVNEFESISLSLKDNSGNTLHFSKGYIAYTIMLRKV